MLSLFVSLAVLATLAVSCSATDAPIQQRIALLPDGMTVSWSTTSALSGSPMVMYGLEANLLSMNASGTSSHYASSTTFFHHVELHGLKPNTTYYWQAQAQTKPTPTLHFITQPAMTTPGDGNFSVAIYGDLGIDNSEDTVRLLRQMARGKEVDLFWHVGDLSYADDHSDTTLSYEQIMEGWLYNMTEVWDETPYMSAAPRTHTPNTASPHASFLLPTPLLTPPSSSPILLPPVPVSVQVLPRQPRERGWSQQHRQPAQLHLVPRALPHAVRPVRFVL